MADLLSLIVVDDDIYGDETKIQKIVNVFPICIIRAHAKYDVKMQMCFPCAEIIMSGLHMDERECLKDNIFRDVVLEHLHFNDAKSVQVFFSIQNSFCFSCLKATFIGVYASYEKEKCWMSPKIEEELEMYKDFMDNFFIKFEPFTKQPGITITMFREKMNGYHIDYMASKV